LLSCFNTSCLIFKWTDLLLHVRGLKDIPGSFLSFLPVQKLLGNIPESGSKISGMKWGKKGEASLDGGVRDSPGDRVGFPSGKRT